MTTEQNITLDLNRSIKLQTKIATLELSAKIFMSMCATFCDEYEAKFDNNEDIIEVFGSVEMTDHYLRTARHLAVHKMNTHILKPNSVFKRVEEAYNNYLPFK